MRCRELHAHGPRGTTRAAVDVVAVEHDDHTLQTPSLCQFLGMAHAEVALLLGQGIGPPRHRDVVTVDHHHGRGTPHELLRCGARARPPLGWGRVAPTDRACRVVGCFVRLDLGGCHHLVAGLAQQLGERRGFAGEPFGRLSPTLRSLRCHMVIVERVEPDRTGVLDPNACSC